MRSSGYGPRQRNKRRVIVLQRVDKYLFRALAQYWNPTYSCFTFGKLDLVPTVEEYTTLLRCPKIQIDKWVAARINQKGDSKCIPWRNLKDLILAFPDVKKRLDVFALSIYGLVIFLKALGHIDEAKVKKASYRIFSENYSPLKESVAPPRRDDITEEKWMISLKNLQDEDVEWKAF
ncbi:hypothetical protein Godav_029583 [Gossypium davidsonii]|uniref:DUF7745 domain-containing protein n=1 Tax=Gossypium davidsonii TaxID=34287 RepID=A0A7J8TIE6_GOSDV|nr:hypothetical protein [Gossypium davidsonii]